MDNQSLYTLADWYGKTDDVIINYNTTLSSEHDLTIGAVDKPNEDTAGLTEAIWDETVKRADRTDYIIAISCGMIAGAIDIFYVGQFSLERAHEWGSDKVNAFVKRIAELTGFKGGDLSDAVRYLEKQFPITADKNTPDFGGGRQHHLRDFSHHFSIGGLICSLYTQFSGKVIGTSTDGSILLEAVKDNELIGSDLPQKLFYGIINWFFHIVSDMAGSNSTAGKGTGVPGPILSLIKQLSAVPFFKDKKINDVEFHTWVSKLFNGTLLGKRDENGRLIPIPFDLRTEIGLLHEVGKQFVPVIINECLVRGSYFIRRFFLAVKNAEIQSINDLHKIISRDLLPFNNRIIMRMVTVSSGTFVVVDSSHALIRAAIKNQGFKDDIFKDYISSINIVGIGRFAVACVFDVRILSDDIRKAKEKRNAAEKKKETEIINTELAEAKAKGDSVLVKMLEEKLEKITRFVGLAYTTIGTAMTGAVSTIKAFVGCILNNRLMTFSDEDATNEATRSSPFICSVNSAETAAKLIKRFSSNTVKNMSNATLPKQMVSTTVNVGKVMARFIKGEITGTECIVQLGEDGFGELGAAMYATAFTTVVKGAGSRVLTVVAGAAGSTIGYMAAVAVYQELKTSLIEYQLAVEERKRIEAECAEAVVMIREYREQMIAAYEQYFTEHLEAFQNGVDAMDKAMIEGDVNGFLGANAQIQIALGRKPQFRTQEEFDNLMLSDESFKL